MSASPSIVLVVTVALFSSAGCDRRVEPFDPDEEPQRPDLSKIFPPELAEGLVRGTPLAPPAPPGARRGAAPVGADPTPQAPPIRGTARLAPELEGRVPPGAVVFIIASGPGGGPPVAVKRLAPARFPFRFELGPDDRMIPTLRFAGPLLLSVRVDTDGNASTREPGDLRGEGREAVNPGETGVEIVVDQML